MLNLFKKQGANKTEKMTNSKKIKTSAPQHKNFKEYVEFQLKKRGIEISDVTRKKIEKYLENPNSILNSPKLHFELYEMIKEREFQKGPIGKWEILYEKFILPIINETENEIKKISKNSKPKKINEEELKKKIINFREAIGRMSKNEITEASYYEAREKYNSALKLFKKLPEDSPFRHEIKENIIKPLKKYVANVIIVEQEINKIEKIEDLKIIILKCKKRIEKILDKIENFQYNGIDTILLKIYPKKLKDAAKRVNYKIEDDNNFKELEKTIDKAYEMLRYDNFY